MVLLSEMLLRLQHEVNKGITFIKSGEQEVFVAYAQLLQQAKRCLYYLQNERGLQPGDELIIQEDDSEIMLTAFWACILGGIIAVPVSTGNKNEHKLKLLKIRETLKRPYLFTGNEHLQRLIAFIQSDVPQTDVLSLQHSTIDAALSFDHLPDTPVLHTAAADDLAFIQYSSGSTGSPKGVMLTHRNLFYNTTDMAERMQLSADDKELSWMPLTHDMGMICYHLTGTLTGCMQYLMPTSLFIRRPLLWMESVNKHRATILYSPNFGYEYFLEALDNKPATGWDLSSVRMIINGAEPISAEVCRRFTTRLQHFGLSPLSIQPGYGMAEASVCVTLNAPGTPLKELHLQRNALGIGDEVISEENAQTGTIGFVNCGLPARHCRVRICGDKDEILRAGTVGHIQISGLNVTEGYYRNEAATNAILTADGWVRTGDLGFLLPSGELVITGRHKNMIILQGQNYYHHDIERILFDVPGIAAGKIVACGIPGDSNEKEKLLLFVLFKGQLNAFATLEEMITEKLGEVLSIIPDHVIPVREVPKTTSGKIQHYEMLQRFRNGEYDEALQQLRELSAQNIIAAWKDATPAAQVRHIESWLREQAAGLIKTTPAAIDLLQPLTDQGLKSLLAVQLKGIIERKLNITAGIGILYRYPSIEKLAVFIHGLLFPPAAASPQTPAEESPAPEALLNKAAALSDEQIALLLNENLL